MATEDQEVLQELYGALREILYLGSEQLRLQGNLDKNMQDRVSVALERFVQAFQKAEMNKKSRDFLLMGS